jgi:hypothetical protein
MEEDGRLVRLYPVPFRLISDHRQFRKWQWVSARIEKAKRDHRQESHKVFIETINCDAKPLATNKNWQARRESLGKLRIFHDFAELEAARLAEGITLGLLRPSTVLGLDLTSVDAPDWTDAEKAKLLHLQEQGNLFDDSDARSIPMLRRLPFDFHYRYVCNVGGGPKEYRHKIVDWEVGALFWNVRSRHGDSWRNGTARVRLRGRLRQKHQGGQGGRLAYRPRWAVRSGQRRDDCVPRGGRAHRFAARPASGDARVVLISI